MRISDWSSDVCSSDLQTPFDIAQCRRDCPAFRAIEDRLGDIGAFLLSSRTDATDLREARENERKAVKPDARYDDGDLVADLERRFGDGAVARGHDVFAANCARCHRSEEHTSELQSLMRISYAVFCLKKKNKKHPQKRPTTTKTLQSNSL